MRISSIELTNYRQYRDKQEVRFSLDEKKNITVIEGANGAGKTNLLNALTWCLYGTEEHLKTEKGKYQGIINDQVIAELKAGQQVRGGVKIFGIETDGNAIRFERAMTVYKESDGRIHFGQQTFDVYKQIGKDMQNLPSSAFIVNRNLPPGVKNFFFFDGERLDEFFRQESSERVKQAISDISQLNLLDGAIDHLEKTIAVIRSEVKGETPKLQQLQDEINSLEKSKTSLLDDKKKEEEKVDGIRKELRNIEEKLRGTNVGVIKELQHERDTLDARVESFENDHDELSNKTCDLVVQAIPLSFCHSALDYALRKIGEAKTEGKLPPAIEKTFVKDLLKRGQCICGSDLKTSPDRSKKLQQLLEAQTISEISSYLLDGKYEISKNLESCQRILRELSDYGKKRAKIEAEIHKTKDRLKEIGTRIKGVDAIELRNLEIARDALSDNMVRSSQDIGELSAKYKQAEQLITLRNKDYQTELSKSAKHDYIKRKLILGGEALELLQTVRKNLITETLKTIEKKTKEYFLSLIWKKTTYSDVKIDENYNISVLNSIGSECLPTLSAGEREVLALSFMAALREVSGFEAPIIIDTPLGRISGEPKQNIAELLPRYLKNAQLVLLVTDQEYTTIVREKLAPHIGQQYKLDYNDAESKTLVKIYE